MTTRARIEKMNSMATSTSNRGSAATHEKECLETCSIPRYLDGTGAPRATLCAARGTRAPDEKAAVVANIRFLVRRSSFSE